MITHLLYRSFSNGEADPKTVDRILQKSRINNARDEITGILLYKNKMFLQVLEGSETAVQKCLTRIRTDHRHYGTGIILTVKSDKRIFPYWQMGFVGESSTLKPFDTVAAVTNATQGHSAPDKGTLIRILRMFADERDLQTAP